MRSRCVATAGGASVVYRDFPKGSQTSGTPDVHALFTTSNHQLPATQGETMKPRAKQTAHRLVAVLSLALAFAAGRTQAAKPPSLK